MQSLLLTAIKNWADYFLFGAVTLDATTNVPLPWLTAGAITLLGVGMWVSAKVTKFEESYAHITQRLADQQAENMRRLNSLDERLCSLEEEMWRRRKP